MDAVKKTAVEKRIVIGLVAVFAVTFIMGPVRSLGLFRRSAPMTGPAQGVGRVSVSKPLPVMLQESWQRMQPTPDPTSESRGAPTAPPAYTAHDLRDPFDSLLPDLQPRAGPRVASGPNVVPSAAVPASPPARPPPTLHVQGILWGGAEPTAIINDQVYGLHDVVAGAEILRIDRDGVLIDYDGTPHQYTPASPTPKGVERSVSRQVH